MLGKCDDCADMFDTEYSFPDLADVQTEWYQWSTINGRWFKVLPKGALPDVIAGLQQQFPAFLTHSFIKQKQSSHFEAEKKKTDWKHIVIQVDFDENYSIFHRMRYRVVTGLMIM